MRNKLLELVVHTPLNAANATPHALLALHKAAAQLGASSWRPRTSPGLGLRPVGSPAGQGASLAEADAWLVATMVAQAREEPKAEELPRVRPECSPTLWPRLMEALRDAGLDAIDPAAPPAGGCPAGVSEAWIHADGVALACPHGAPGQVDLSARWLDFGQAWLDDPAFVKLRDPAGFEGVCGYCEFRKACGGCRGRGARETGNPLAPDPGCEHEPRRLARDKPLVLVKVPVDQPDSRGTLTAPDAQLVAAVAAACRVAGLAPQVIAGYRGESPEVATFKAELQDACAALGVPTLAVDLQTAPVQTEPLGSADDAQGPILDFDHIVTVAALRDQRPLAATQTATCLLPEPLAGELAVAMSGSAERELHRVASRHLQEKGIESLRLLTPEGAWLVLNHTVSSGLWILQAPADGLLLGGTRAAALDKAAWEVLGVEPPQPAAARKTACEGRPQDRPAAAPSAIAATHAADPPRPHLVDHSGALRDHPAVPRRRTGSRWPGRRRRRGRALPPSETLRVVPARSPGCDGHGRSNHHH